MKVLRLCLATALALAIVTSSHAQQTASKRVRGTIEAVEAGAITVKTRDGPVVKIALPENVAVTGVSKLDLGAIQPNSFVGAASLKQPDGTLVALEVVVFPEAARGSGEGHYAWDLQPDSMMTNATVGAVAQRPNGRMLELTYKDGKQTMLVPEGVPVVTFAPADRGLLVKDAAIFIGGATVAADGSLSAARVLVGKDGTIPPM